MPADEWADDGAAAAPGNPAPAGDGPTLLYPTLDRFVADHLTDLYRRPLGRSRTWCATWWRHPEAVARLDALWRSWEHLRQDPALGMSVWFRDHVDTHMPVLMDPDGPLKGCTPDKHAEERLPRLRCEPPPDGLFTA